MYRRNVLAAAILLLVSATVAQAAEPIKWQKDYNAAKLTARKSHKLILVDFYADW